MTNPCREVNNLFAIKYLLEDTKSVVSGLTKESENEQLLKAISKIDEHLKGVDYSLQKTGLTEVDQLFQNYKIKQSGGISLSTKRLFVLKCINEHVHTYEIDCDD